MGIFNPLRGEVRLPALVAVVLAAIGGLAATPAAAGANPTEVCNPSPKVASSFCITYDLTLASTPPGLIAAAPFDVDVSINNTSTGFSGDKNRWLNSATIRLADAGGVSQPVLTRSSDLPNGLLLAGGGSCTTPAYTDCPGGNGALVAEVSLGPTLTNGAFGISEIKNVNPPGAGIYADYLMTIQSCVNFGGPCIVLPPIQQELTIPEPTAGAQPDPSLTIATRGTKTCCGGSADYSISSAAIHLAGQSSQTDTGPAGQTYTILSLPRDCGTATGSSVFTAGDLRTVTVPQSVTIVDCPTAAPTHTPSGFSAHFNAGGSSTPVLGRTIAHYLWSFGDGETQTTSGPTVNHVYDDFGNHTATLRVVDSAGARSQLAQRLVPGTRTTIRGRARRGRIRARGTVAPSHSGAPVSVELLRRRHGQFRQIATKHLQLNTASAFRASFHRPHRGRCELIATFPGDGDHLASSATRKLRC